MICSAFYVSVWDCMYAVCSCSPSYSVVCLLIGLFEFYFSLAIDKATIVSIRLFPFFQCNRYLVIAAADTSLTPTSIVENGLRKRKGEKKQRKKIIKNLTRKQMMKKNVHWLTQFVQSNFLYTCAALLSCLNHANRSTTELCMPGKKWNGQRE